MNEAKSREIRKYCLLCTCFWPGGKVNKATYFNAQGVWKSQKKSHSTLRAKRAYILSGQKLIINAKNGQFLRGGYKTRLSRFSRLLRLSRLF